MRYQLDILSLLKINRIQYDFCQTLAINLAIIELKGKITRNENPLWSNKEEIYYPQDDVGGIYLPKEIEIILRLFLVIDIYCQASSSQFNQSLNLPHC